MATTQSDVITGSTIIFAVGSVVCTTIFGFIVWFVKGILNDNKKNTLNNALISQQLVQLGVDMSSIRKSMEDLKDIKTDIQVLKTVINNMKESQDDLKKMTYNNTESIVKIKDDILHIYKELK